MFRTIFFSHFYCGLAAAFSFLPFFSFSGFVRFCTYIYFTCSTEKLKCCDKPVRPKYLLVECNKRENMKFGYVTLLNCYWTFAAKNPSSILDPYLNARWEFPSNSHVTLYNIPCSLKKEMPLKWLHWNYLVPRNIWMLLSFRENLRTIHCTVLWDFFLKGHFVILF